MTPDEVYKAFLELPKKEQVRHAERVLEVVDDEPYDPEFVAELDRRSADVREGKVELIPWEEVEEGALALLDDLEARRHRSRR